MNTLYINFLFNFKTVLMNNVVFNDTVVVVAKPFGSTYCLLPNTTTTTYTPLLGNTTIATNTIIMLQEFKHMLMWKLFTFK